MGYYIVQVETRERCERHTHLIVTVDCLCDTWKGEKTEARGTAQVICAAPLSCPIRNGPLLFHTTGQHIWVTLATPSQDQSPVFSFLLLSPYVYVDWSEVALLSLLSNSISRYISHLIGGGRRCITIAIVFLPLHPSHPPFWETGTTKCCPTLFL